MRVADVFDVGRVVSQNFDQVQVAVASCDMQTREAHLVLYLGISAVIHEFSDDLNHVAFGSQMHRRVETGVLVVLGVHIRSLLD